MFHAPRHELGHERIALFGGIYSNYLALDVAIQDARRRGCTAVFCLGDLGAFGPTPDRVFPLLWDNEVACLRGNYDDSIGHALDDCQCGYTDPRDNYFAKLSYDYTLAKTSPEHRAWLRTLPSQRRVRLADKELLLCHGSPRRVNEFLWESTTPKGFLDVLAREHSTDWILATHTGLHWRTPLATGGEFVNVGVLGRPANDGTTRVWYTVLDGTGPEIRTEFVPVDYDHNRLAAEMRSEGLPDEFVATIQTGWWTTCLEVLPSKERRRGVW
jgi:diadenosine tetraphosphatase ApaH/serine/threonine PP2A family protein phosphatase